MGDDDGGDDVYNGKVEPVLVSLSDLYSDDEAISVSDSRSSSYPAYTVTNYFYQPTTALRKRVCNFDLRRSFYSK